MKCLIDADVIKYEIGFCGEYVEEGELIVREWDFVQSLLDNRIKGICLDTDADEPPRLYMTGDASTHKIENRWRKYNSLPPIITRDPFRNSVATQKPYKGTRKGSKPVHYYNIIAYLIAEYDCYITDGYMEADDAMSIDQNKNTIICTRDKDLRMVPGNHFGWECGKQPSFGPELVDKRGWLKKNAKGDVKGVGQLFFYYQMLVGDTVDNIPGCPNIGAVKAFDLLKGVGSRKDAEAIVRASYEAVYGDVWKERLEEQSKLLWMVRELDEYGQPVFYDWKLNG